MTLVIQEGATELLFSRSSLGAAASGTKASREDKPAPWFGDGSAQFERRLDPLSNENLNTRQRLLVRRSIGRAACELGNLGDESLILLAPMQDNLVLNVGLQQALPEMLR
jgi:hypothetical protein